jgi:hypothetical protein
MKWLATYGQAAPGAAPLEPRLRSGNDPSDVGFHRVAATDIPQTMLPAETP